MDVWHAALCSIKSVPISARAIPAGAAWARAVAGAAPAMLTGVLSGTTEWCAVEIPWRGVVSAIAVTNDA